MDPARHCAGTVDGPILNVPSSPFQRSPFYADSSTGIPAGRWTSKRGVYR